MYVCFYVWRRPETIWKHVVVPKLCQNHEVTTVLENFWGFRPRWCMGPTKPPFLFLGRGGYIVPGRTHMYI